MPRKRMDFLIETFERRDSMFRGYGGIHLCLTEFEAFLFLSCFFRIVVPIVPQVTPDAPLHLRYFIEVIRTSFASTLFFLIHYY